MSTIAAMHFWHRLAKFALGFQPVILSSVILDGSTGLACSSRGTTLTRPGARA